MKKGFTIVELLIVVAIIGIMVSILLVRGDTAKARSRDARRVADISNLQSALEGYFEGETKITQSSSTTVTPKYPATISSLAPNYIAVIPTDPAESSAYGYLKISDESYCLGAKLEKGIQVSAGTMPSCDNGGTFDTTYNYRVKR